MWRGIFVSGQGERGHYPAVFVKGTFLCQWRQSVSRQPVDWFLLYKKSHIGYLVFVRVMTLCVCVTVNGRVDEFSRNVGMALKFWVPEA